MTINSRSGVRIANLRLRLEGIELEIENFSLEPGKVYGLFGLSNSGASEFLYLLGGLRGPLEASLPAQNGSLVRVQQELSEEELRKVLLDGLPLFEMHPVERARRVGFVFENPEWSMLGGTVLEDFWYSFAAIRVRPPSMQGLVPYGLFEKRQQSTETLSGGERHRLNCASVLEYSRDMYIVDLSSSNLDREFLHDFISWIVRRAHAGAIVVIYGLRSDELPPGAQTIIVSDGAVSFGQPDEALFPSSIAEYRELGKVISKSVESHDRSDQPPLLEVREAWGRYSIAPLSCSLRAGEILVVEGRNGSGKTTLGRLIAERKDPFRGDIFIEDWVLPVMAFQHPEHCFLASSVWSELPNQELLSKCGITEVELSEHPRNLSRSKQKLLSVATALSLSKGFAILDEPTCGMDYLGKKRFMNIVNSFQDIGILIFTHDRSLHVLGKVYTLGGVE